MFVSTNSNLLVGIDSVEYYHNEIATPGSNSAFSFLPQRALQEDFDCQGDVEPNHTRPMITRMAAIKIHQMALKALRPKIATRSRKRIAAQNIICHHSKMYHPSAAAATPLAIIRGGRQCNANCFGEKGKGSKKRECLDA